jgi:hypothetical protein
MDLTDFFDKNELKKADMAIAKINGMVGKTITIPSPIKPEEELINLNEVFVFPVYIGEIKSEARFAMDRCVAQFNNHRINNLSQLGKVLIDFANLNLKAMIWFDLPELRDSSQIGTYLVEFVYFNHGKKQGEIVTGLKFTDPTHLPQARFVKWMRTNGYFYLSGQMDVTPTDVGDKLDLFEIYSINYYDDNTGRKQDVIPYVPF